MKTASTLRRLLLALAALIVLAMGALAIWLSQLDVGDIVAVVEDQAQQATGRTLRIRGPVSLEWSLVPTIAVENVSLQNAPWGSARDMLSARRVQVQLALLPLLSGNIEIRKVVLDQPKALLEVDAKGRKNWEFEQRKPPSENKLSIDIAEVRVDKGEIDYRVAQPRSARKLFVERLALRSSGAHAQIDAALAMNNVPLTVAGALPNPLQLGKGEGAVPVDLQITSKDNKISVAGDVPLSADLSTLAVQLKARFADLQSLGKFAAVEVPKLPPFDVDVDAKGDANGIQITSGKLTTTAAALEAKGFVATKSPDFNGSRLVFDMQADDPAATARQFGHELSKLPKTRIAGEATIAKSVLQANKLQVTSGKTTATAQLSMPMNQARRKVTFKLDAPLVDMRELFGPLEPAPKSATKKTRIFSAEPLPVDALRKVDANGDVRIAKLMLRDARQVDNLAARFDLNNGKLAADSISMTVEKQPLQLRLTADASRQNRFTVDARAQGDNVPLGALATLAGVQTNLQQAPTDLTVNFAASGLSMRELMASADGDVRAVVGAGRWKGQAFDMGEGLARVFDIIAGTTGSGDITQLQCAVLRFPINRGVIVADNGIALETNKIKMLAAGRIDLRNETLDLGVKPRAGSNALSGGVGSLAKLARIGGTLAEPTVKLDAANAVGTALDIGIALSGKEGGSALTKRLLTSDAPEQPCQIALGKAPAPAAPAATPEAAKKQPLTIPKEVTPEQAIDALRGLFGGKR